MGRGSSPEIHTDRNKDIYAMARDLGVKAGDFQEEDTGSQGHFDSKGFEEAVMNAAANDYDYRRATEAAVLAGKKDIPNKFQSVDDTRAIYNWMKDQHQGGGKFSSAQDYANITNRMVNQDRSVITNQIDELKTQMLDQAKEKKKGKTVNKGPVVLSDRLQRSQNIVDQFENADTDQEAATQAFVNDFKFDVFTGMDLKPNETSNLSNAAKAVTDPYGR